MTDKNMTQQDPFKLNSVKIPQQPKAQRNPLGYRSKQNLKRTHEVREVTQQEQEERQRRGIREALDK